ncbi:MBL fold metallo-hydrolase [Halorussus halobius]|uniref:MBL fold metallo-hydrolase n=1 Tax=Halorussus halobius TaxID=1710537 RepID=UPI00109210FB|nr:MBL fold metallo-hydrolase [Halorussus halobius]
MGLTYQHLNPTSGGGSYLLRFPDAVRERTPCLLVDSGVGVDLDAALADDDYLAAALLTHAHLDHYATLAESLRDGAPVYAAAATAAVLDDVLAEGEKNYDIGAVESVLDAVVPIDGWETVVSDVEVAPVPAGHAPAAAGFVVRFRDGSRTNHVLFTGDFTARPVAGYPGLDADLPFDIDVLFANVSTAGDFEETLSEALFTVVERARAGSSVLVTASALTGVHVAYLLGHLGERVGASVPVRLVGQAAKLYADLGYDVPDVDAVPVFDSPGDVLDRDTVTVAGPEVPSAGSARRLFEAIEDDSAATLVQVTGGATDPVGTAGCTVYDYEVVNHPASGAVDALVESLDPIHVVAGHGPDREIRSFRGRYDERFVWAGSDDREQTLYGDGRWSPPPWLSEPAVKSIRARDWRSNGVRSGEAVTDGDGLPAVARDGAVDLDAEGVEVGRFEARFGDADEDATGAVAGEPDDAERASAAESGADDLAADSGSARGASPPDADHPAVADAETFRSEVLGRLDALESTVGGDAYRARVADAGGDVTLLRLLEEADLDHGEELTVVVAEPDGERSVDG